MSRKSSLCVVLSLFAVGMLMAGVASATPIAVPNFSFEDPVIETDGGTSNGLVDWTYTGTGTFWIGAYNPKSTAINGGVDGANIACSYAAADNDSVQALSGPLGVPGTPELLQVGTYTLKVAAGVDNGFGQQDLTLALGTVASGDLATQVFAGSTIPAGSLTDKTLTWTVAPGDLHLGQQLRIGITGSNGLAGTEVQYDNVRLDFVASPEPGTLAILASGLIGLLCYAWRKRK
jgi:hypothetical protein